MNWLHSFGIVFTLAMVNVACAYGDEVFFAREFLYTRTFKMGIDLFPDGFPMASNPRGIYVAGTFLVTALGPLQRIFDTTSLTSSQWGICLLGPLGFLAATELGKWYDRRRGGERQPGVAAPPQAAAAQT